MKITKCIVSNFASYKDLEFDFTEGLTLLHGATGSGKSTLNDVIPWCLFGTTAKNGTVDEVISWDAEGPTKVTLILQLNATTSVQICRTRGKKANDLWYSAYDHNLYSPSTILPNARGKDLNDTQKQLETLLGITADLYLAGAYYHEFSQTAQFFTTNAKNRRTICEQIVDLSLSKSLSLKLTDKRKTYANNLKTAEQAANYLEGRLSSIDSSISSVQVKLDGWAKLQSTSIKGLEAEVERFAGKQELKILELENLMHIAEEDWTSKTKALNDHLSHKDAANPCVTCGSTTNATKYNNILKTIKDDIVKAKTRLHSAISQVRSAVSETNPYIDQLLKIKKAINPHLSMLEDLKTQHETSTTSLVVERAAIETTKTGLEDIELLSEAVVTLRTTVIRNAIQDINDNTNQLLSNYFDAEIKVEFSIEDDKLDVLLQKDGNECSFTQLSKGQRTMLKLCFGVSVMKQVAKYSGVTFSQIFFDEALDGLDETLKVKAYQLLVALSVDYTSVFVVEHSTELKTLFPKKIKVQLIEGRSVLSED